MLLFLLLAGLHAVASQKTTDYGTDSCDQPELLEKLIQDVSRCGGTRDVLLKLAAGFDQLKRDIGEIRGNEHLHSSCKEILQANSDAPSGEYRILTANKQLLRKVYCEMGLSGGGYTFLRPSDLLRLTSEEVQALFTDRTSFLMRVRKSDSSQPYGVLEQLPQYRNLPMKLGLNENTNYNAPLNAGRLDRVYLYYGFLPISHSANRNIQGLQVNNVSLTFRNGDSNPNSYIALFPNFRERTPTSYCFNVTWSFCDNLFAELAPNPSTRLIPNEYFMFMETHWGGGGCYTQTDARLYRLGVLGAAIGFK